MRTDIAWAELIVEAPEVPDAGFALGSPDGLSVPVVENRVLTLAGWSRASYEGLAELLGTVTAGDAVTPEMLASTDVLAFELNGGHPAASGGWESCAWTFTDGTASVAVTWNEATVEGTIGGTPVPRDPRVVANGSITGAAYAAFFGISRSAIVLHPALTPETVVVSFLLFQLRDVVDVHSPTFTVTVSGVPNVPGIQEASPDFDAIGVLSHVEGLSAPPPKKPRKSAARRVKELCDTFRTQEAVVPAFAALWDRHAAGQSSRNALEASIFEVFDGFDAEQRGAMTQGFAGYRAFRSGGTGTCLFDDRLADAVATRPLEPTELATELIREGAAVAFQQFFPLSGGIGAGLVRPWPQVFPPEDIVKGEPVTVTAPWPWITAIRLKTDSDHSGDPGDAGEDEPSVHDFGSRASFRPHGNVPNRKWQPYQFDQTCRFTPVPGGPAVPVCERVHPPPPPPGSFSGGECEGESDYNVAGDCLRIPSISAGGEFALRGFNFVTPSIDVHLQLRDAPPGSAPFTQHCVVLGDAIRPATDAEGRVIADWRVRDMVPVPVPAEDPLVPGAPFRPGMYEVWVSVAAEPGAAPAVRESNKLLVRIEPSPDIVYLLRSERGRCIEETSGAGDDEIWWDAFVGHIVPHEIPPDNVSSGVTLNGVERKPFPREPWADMDDLEVATHVRDLFGPKKFELGGVVCVAIVGFEVDDEKAARQQLQGFANAFWEGLKTAVAAAFVAEGTVIGIAQLAVKAGVVAPKVALTVGLVGGAIIAGITLASVALWAAWAPADLIALDVLVLDPVTSFDRTDPAKPLPAETSRQLRGNEVLVSSVERGLPKQGNPEQAAVPYVFEVEYASEDARYALQFRLTRTAVP